MKKIISGVLVVAAEVCLACTTVIAGRKATASGYVLVGHNEDFGCKRMEHAIVPPQDWPQEAFLPQVPDQAPIKQVSHTYGFYWSSSVGSSVTPLCDSAMNEKGVFVTMNYGGKSRTEGETSAGGVRDLLLRVVVERARSAHEGAVIAVDLLKKYGLTRGGWAWTIADRNEAFLIQGVNGRHFVASRVPDDKVVLIPNVLTVREMPPETMKESIPAAELSSYAEAKGWKKADEPFDFSKCYQKPDWFMHPHSVMRFKLGAKVITGKAWEGDCVYALTPAKPITPQLMRQVLSQHVVEGAAAHVDAPGPICRVETGESSVCEFAAEVKDTTLHVAFGPPCIHPWLLLHPFAVGVPPSLAVPDAVRRLEEQVLRKPYVKPISPNAWDRIVAAVRQIVQKGPAAISAWQQVKKDLDAAALARQSGNRAQWKEADEKSSLAAVYAAEKFAAQ